ncbi:MAG: type II toxin-antitoxin system PemK/MazF family toxin [Deltaproteobacteria bacterium]|nr:type II toxin-antitoxin system PemK/MazF family toxin [Deltaproteobacteria bacterium]
MKPGDIYTITIDSIVQNHSAKELPVIVLNAGHHRYLRLSVVAPVTEWKEHLDKNPFFVSFESDGETGLTKKSIIDCFQLRAVSHTKFKEKIGTLSRDKLQQIRKSIALILDIEPEDCE